ncbi:unnamed protein product [Blepharisma stoltei]|uniref:Uncharacterized protein n=1 Tax=Blepharisma stoltei TaxID=1481888 RepID=A0AAU9J337_9CILI|nr:unnamed protein product [Blepharisma stoltei]
MEQDSDEKIIKSLKLAIISSIVTTIIVSDLIADSIIDTKYTVAIIPSIFAIITIPVTIHLAMNIFCNNLKPTSKNLVIFCIYSGAVSILCFMILCALSVDKIIEISWWLIWLPGLFAILTYFIFCVFLIPGLLDPIINLKRYAFLLAIWLVTLLASLGLLGWYLEDTEISDRFIYMWIPLMVSSLINLFVNYAYYREDTSSTYLLLIENLTCLYILMFSILIILSLTVLEIRTTIISLPLLAFFATLVYFEISDSVRPKSPLHEQLSNKF